MATTASRTPVSTTLEILDELLGDLEPRNFAVRLWDGTVWRPAEGEEPAFTLVVEHPSSLRRLLRPGSEAALAEAYLDGHLSIEGDIFAVPAFGRAVLARDMGLTERARLALKILRLPRDDRAREAGHVEAPERAERADHPGPGRVPEADLHGEVHSVERDRDAVTHHYDLSNRFYSIFLDPRMVYSCAVFRDVDEPLESAQRRKLDLICRKLRIRDGDRLLDIGCGWGALLIHAAAEHGADALGITLSEQQAELARERIREAGLTDRCRVEVRDYRTLETGAFDRVASVGMFEHVGRARAPEYFETIHRILRPGGSYLHHAITANPTVEWDTGQTLSDRFVFPDHELIAIGETLVFAEDAGFDVRDVEGLREHYARTLRHWVAALEARRGEAVAEVGEAAWRAWHLTFAGAALEFEAGRQNLHQALLVRKQSDGSAALPLGRWDWYEGRA